MTAFVRAVGMVRHDLASFGPLAQEAPSTFFAKAAGPGSLLEKLLGPGRPSWPWLRRFLPAAPLIEPPKTGGPDLPPNEREVIDELFGGSHEAVIAWQGVKEGWDIRKFEQELGADAMTLLIRQQMIDTPDILSLRWRTGRQPPFRVLLGRSTEDYLAVRSSLPAPDHLMYLSTAGRSAPSVVFIVRTREVPIPFVSFRNYESSLAVRGAIFERTLVYYDMPRILIAKWPRALLFHPEKYLHPQYIRIDERWMLGGVPSRFVVFRGEAMGLEAIVATQGGPEAFLQSLQRLQDPS